MPHQPARRIGALALVTGLLTFLAPPVGAEPPPPPPPGAGGGVVDAPTLSLRDIGGSEAITMDVRQDLATTSLYFAVPDGLVPAALNATLELPIDLRFGNLTVSQGDRTLSRMPLPARDRDQRMVIPLKGAEVFGGWASISLTMTVVPIDGYCWDPMAPVRLIDTAVTFAGREIAPRTVAEFLSPVLRTITIGIPDKPSRTESNAAVQLAAAMANRYGGQNPDISVVALPGGATTFARPSAPLERQIVVKEGPDKGVSLQGDAGVPSLLIAGPGDELTNQTRLLTDDSLQYAVSRKAVPGGLVTKQGLVTDATTLQQLKISSLNSQTLWPKIGLELSQNKFGHPVETYRVHVNGSHTPLPADFGGELLAMVDGKTIDRWAVTDDGVIDHWVTIPVESVNRTTNLQIMVHTTGDAGRCGDFLPMAMRLDEKSEVEATPATVPLPPGFQSYPQVLMPTIQIGIGQEIFADTVRAAQIAVGLQRSAGNIPLVTVITEAQQALKSGKSAIVIAAEGWSDNTIPLPVVVEKETVTVEAVDKEGENVKLSLDPAVRFGSLQTVFDGKRSLMIATSTGSANQLDQLLGWLAGERGRWPGLNGRAILSVPGMEPVVVPNPPKDIVKAEKSGGGGLGLIWKVVGGLVTVAVIGAALIIWRARRLRSRSLAR